MDLSGTVLREVAYVVGGGSHTHSYGVVPRGSVRVSARPRMVMGGSGFCDEGHLQYYQDKKKGPVVMTTKKKLKLLKGLSKGLNLFPQLGFDLDPEKRALLDDIQGNLTSEATEALVKQLEQLRAEEKEMKRKRKQEKKAKIKASKAKMNCESSSSESSDGECGEVVDMDSLRAGVAPAPVEELQPLVREVTMPSQPALVSQTTTIVENPREDAGAHHHAMELCSRNDTCAGSISASYKNEITVVTAAPQKRIEVCMGNKCKRSGAAALLQEFGRVMGVEGGAVVGCKCMGKCKSAPNVRIQNSVDDGLAEGLNDSVKIPANPLCIGVGLEDVDTIVARFLGENQKDMGMAASAT